jgi:hypothetical protein
VKQTGRGSGPFFFGYPSRMSLKYVAAGVGVAVAGIVGYVAWGAHQTREEHRALSALVTSASSDLAAVLKQPAAEQAQRLAAAAGSLQGLGVRKQKAYADAADVYLVSVRAIAQRQAEVEQLAKQAREAREALVAHMRGPRGRNDLWIRQATDLQKRMDQVHNELARKQEALIEVLRTMPLAEEQLAAFAGPAVVTDPALHAAALKRAEDDLKRAAQEAYAARRLY